MYTTLALLKSVKACVPGYGRQISFFGTKAALKDQKIPLCAVALIGGKDDVGWALSNGVVLDKEQFDVFFRRHAVSVFKSLCSSNIYSGGLRDFKHKTVKELVTRSTKIHTFDELTDFLKEARGYNFDHALWNSVIDDVCWTSPAKFIEKCLEILDKTYTTGNNWSFPMHLINPHDPKDRIHIAPAPTPAPATEPVAVEAAPAVAPSQPYGFDSDDEEEDERPRRAPRGGVGKKKASSPIKCYWISSTRSELSAGQNAGHLFDESPYDFLGTLEYKLPKNVSIVVENGEPVMRTEVTEKKTMFYMLRELTARSAHHEDQDGSSSGDDEPDEDDSELDEG